MSTAMASELQLSFGENVRRRRLELEWTQAELAKKTGFSQCRISEIENGRHAPTLETVEKIAEVFGVAPKKLL